MRHVLFMILLLIMAGCSVETKDAEVAVESGDASSAAAPPPPPPRQFHVVVISGMNSDPTKAQIDNATMRGHGNSGMFQFAGDLKAKGLECSFYNWNGTEAGNGKSKEAPGSKRIADDMKSLAAKTPELEFLLVGHSWGGHAILEIASLLNDNQKINIVKVFVIDPSSTMRGERAETLPGNIPEMDNYFTANSFCWGEWKDEPRVNNVSLADPDNGFCIDGHPNYAGVFDWNAHTAAEWDQKIHAEICGKLEMICGGAESANELDNTSQ